MSINSTSPATLFGGTWERIQDRFLLAAGSTYAAGNTGGEATHTLTYNEMPNHSHGMAIKYYLGNSGTGTHSGDAITGHVGASSTLSTYHAIPAQATDSQGNGAAHNNMPPYLAVYVWKRLS